MKTTREEWNQKLTNLHTRTKGISSEHQIDYPRLLKKIKIGKRVLDVGAGTRWLQHLIPGDCHYTGLDAYLGTNGNIKGAIEDLVGAGPYYDTLFVFAALDGMRDLEKAFAAMRELAKQNIVILTGVEIDPDLYHTHKITRELITEQMEGFTCTYEEYVHPKIVFLEYTKI